MLLQNINHIQSRFDLKKIGHVFCIICILYFGIRLCSKTLKLDNQTQDYKAIQSVLWSDASGYYVYLPALFIYHFSSENFPDSCAQFGGNGFKLENNKVVSKYPLGVAIAYSPFFIVAHLIAKEKNGYTRDYHRAMRLAAVFYCTLGLLFCFLFFSQYVNNFVALVILYPLYYGTNLMYATMKMPVYSHILAFCLITCFVYCVSIFKRNPKHWCKWLLPLLFGFIIAVRTINGIVILMIPLWDYTNFNDLIAYSKKLIKDYKFILSFILGFLIFQIPQFLYNIYLFGTIWAEPYPEEHFSFITHPKISVVLFGAVNGLYIYTPLFFLITFCNLFALQEKFRNSLLIIFYFLAIAFIYGSWYNPTMGCGGFSHRAYTDYTGLLALPFVWTLDLLLKKKKYILVIVTGTAIYFCCSITSHIYDFYWYCFYGKGDWDYYKIINDYFNFHHLIVN